MGLGSFGGGTSCAAWLARHGAHVHVTDLADEQTLADTLADDRLAQCTFTLGAHDHEDFAQAEVVVVNPAVPHPWDNPYLQTARDAGAVLTTEIRLAVECLDRSRVIGITGSVGKSTTAAMTHHLLEAIRHPSVLGGNFGGSLLGVDVGEATVVLELSSAQLHWLGPVEGHAPWSPAVSAITNITPNHLDWHGDLAHYRQCKHGIAAYGDAGDTHLLGQDVPPLPEDCALAVPGTHNRINAATAIALVQACVDVDRGTLLDAIGTFTGLAHRLCPIDDASPPRFVDDSKSSTPEATIRAVDALESPGRVHLIAGGYDKGVSLAPIANLAPRLAGLYTIGATGRALADDAGGHAHDCGTLEHAVAAAIPRMRDGDTLLLSPGCASWDQFDDFRARGQAFAALVAPHVSPTRDRAPLPQPDR